MTWFPNIRFRKVLASVELMSSLMGVFNRTLSTIKFDFVSRNSICQPRGGGKEVKAEHFAFLGVPLLVQPHLNAIVHSYHSNDSIPMIFPQSSHRMV